MKPIRLSSHAVERIQARGATVREVEEAIRSARWEPAERGRQECRRDIPYGRAWNGKIYATKQVRPIFLETGSEILVVTVYVYYF